VSDEFDNQNSLWPEGLLASAYYSNGVRPRNARQRWSVIGERVRRLDRLAFRAPRIVEAIAAGHPPPELTAMALTERIELPLL
jgi:hypothetical protein